MEKKKTTPEIDWEKVKNKKDEETKQSKAKKQNTDVGKNEVSEERLAQIMAEVASQPEKTEQNEAKQVKLERKDEIKEALHKKYEKSKLRPANLVTVIFLILTNVILLAELMIVIWFIFKGFIFSTNGLEAMFGKDESLGSILSGFGFVIYLFILIASFVVAGGGVYLSVMSVLDTMKLTYLKDEDLMMNIYVEKITLRETVPLIPIELILMFVVPFFGPKTILQYAFIVNIFLAVIHLGCIISVLVQSIVAKIKFKKVTPEDKYREIVSEKRRIQRLYSHRQRSDGAGRLY